MAQTVENNLALFRILADTSDAQRLVIVKTLSPSQIRGLLETVYNVLSGTCPINDKVKKTLYHQRRIIHHMVSTELTRQQHHRLLVKHRAVLSLLLKPVVEILE